MKNQWGKALQSLKIICCLSFSKSFIAFKVLQVVVGSGCQHVYMEKQTCVLCVYTPAVAPVTLQLLGACPSCPAIPDTVPPAGPFISVVLSKLENMLENSLHVNLLLIGIITQLASYPQPLLRSFLLNTNMVFQPSVRSLYQVRTATPIPSVLPFLL